MATSGENVVAGVDGAKGEWVIAMLDGSRVSWLSAASVTDVVAATAHCAAVGVDMPLRLPSNTYRACEIEAREFLGPARSSIFFSPIRAVLDAVDYEDACRISRSITGKAISKQTWFLVPSIKAWGDAAPDPKRVEVHPECSFRHMAPGTTFASKKSGKGVGQRLAAIGSWADIDSMLDGLGRISAGPAFDDVLDAAAAAWSARRWLLGEHREFGGPGGIVA